jgi:hypothetical protein
MSTNVSYPNHVDPGKPEGKCGEERDHMNVSPVDDGEVFMYQGLLSIYINRRLPDVGPLQLLGG